MNVYDFDRTIFPGDSSIHFWRFCIKKYPSTLKVIPKATVAMIKYKRKSFTWTQVMQTFFKFLKKLPSVEEAVEAFWDDSESKIYKWYLDQKREDDIIISAAPYFLISSIAKRLGVRCIATDMDIKTGDINGEQCAGEEKLKGYRAEYGDEIVDEFYSDSYSDTPMAKIAKKAFHLDKGEISPWDFNCTDDKQSKKEKKKSKK